ncbi:MAG: P63C domain-containing protein [bacterium]|nr:P63C domain-containing protein [bacterium]
MKSSKSSSEELKQAKLLQEKKNADILQNSIFEQTEAQVKDKFSDKELDAENLKRKLVATDLWKMKNLDVKIRRNPMEYEAIFTQEYYQEMFRLNNWTYKGIIAEKPWQAGRYTKQIIYFRFSQEVLPILQIINPFIITGYRQYKHHQYLTAGSRIKLSKFIAQATDLMRECSDWNEFRIKYHTMYNVPYQLKMTFW